jgi:hypothetical protein
MFLMDEEENPSQAARRKLFHKGMRRGFLTVQEVEDALPEGSISASERWLLYFSLRAAKIEVRGLAALPGVRRRRAAGSK